MKDRVVQYPSRYQLVPVAGTTDQFDLVAVPGIVTAAGTDLNKANLLKDATAALFGLANTAVPDDVLAAIPGEIGKANGESLLRDMKIMLNLALKSTNINAWADLLADASGINTGASSGYKIADEKLSCYNIQQMNTGGAQYIGRESASVYAGNSFTPTSSFTLKSITVRLVKIGTPTDNVYVSLTAANANLPTGAVIADSTNQISGSSITGTYADYTFTFPETALTANSQYAFVVKRTGSIDYSNYYRVSTSGTDSLSGGSQFHYNAGWVADAGSDLYFTIEPKTTVVWNAVTPAEALAIMAVTADQSAGIGSITWYLSDDGTNWTQITSLDTMQTVNFDVASVRLKCVLTGNAEVRAVAWGGY